MSGRAPAKTGFCHASGAQIGAAIGVDGLPIYVARTGPTQKTHRCGNVFRQAAIAGDGLMGQVMRRLRFVLGPWRADQPGNHAVHGDAVIGKIVGQRPRQADDARLRRHHMRAILRTRMRAEAADIDDRSRT